MTSSAFLKVLAVLVYFHLASGTILNFSSIQEFYDTAKDHLSETNRLSWHYLEDGSDDGFVLQQNRLAHKNWVIRPRVLTDVSQVKLNTTILGKPTPCPIGISPSAFHKIFHPDGEVATAKGEEAAGAIFILSGASSFSIEDVAAGAPRARKWLNVYLYQDRDRIRDWIVRGEVAGYEALVVTVDQKLSGKKPAVRRILHQNYIDLKHSPLSPLTTIGEIDGSFSWGDLEWIRKHTQLPLILKGILTPQDAVLAVRYKVDGIIVSNHGGRQLGSVLPSIEALPPIVEAVAGRIQIYIDGGFMLGTDVFKALALGADMVFLGRPPLWGLTLEGSDGVKEVLEIFKSELDTAIRLSGVATISDIGKEFVQRFQHNSWNEGTQFSIQ